MLPIVKHNRFIKKWVGRRIDYDKKYLFQCVDLIRQYVKDCKMPAITTRGNAIDLWSNGLGPNYTRVYNTLLARPPIGAIVFWKQGKYGHVAICGQANLLWMEIVEQNGGQGGGTGLGNNAIRVRKDLYKNCLGWMVSK